MNCPPVEVNSLREPRLDGGDLIGDELAALHVGCRPREVHDLVADALDRWHARSERLALHHDLERAGGRLVDGVLQRVRDRERADLVGDEARSRRSPQQVIDAPPETVGLISVSARPSPANGLKAASTKFGVAIDTLRSASIGENEAGAGRPLLVATIVTTK